MLVGRARRRAIRTAVRTAICGSSGVETVEMQLRSVPVRLLLRTTDGLACNPGAGAEYLVLVNNVDTTELASSSALVQALCTGMRTGCLVNTAHALFALKVNLSALQNNETGRQLQS